MCTRFLMRTYKVLIFTPQGDMFIWKRRENRKTSLSVMKMMNTVKCCQFQSYLCWYNKGCVVLKFRIYHVWFQGIIQTSLLRTWLIYGAKSLPSTKTMDLPLKTSLSLETHT